MGNKGPRTLDKSLEEPWFKKRRAKNRKRSKVAAKSRRVNRKRK